LEYDHDLLLAFINQTDREYRIFAGNKPALDDGRSLFSVLGSPNGTVIAIYRKRLTSWKMFTFERDVARSGSQT
jgi:hypothetical protein